MKGGSTEGRLRELQKLKKQGELASAWLRERGLTLEGSPARGGSGEGVSTESEEMGRR